MNKIVVYLHRKDTMKYFRLIRNLIKISFVSKYSSYCESDNTVLA